MDISLTRGERFKDARTVYNKHGKQTMDQVYADTGVPASKISVLENDDIERGVDYHEIARLAEHYGVSADWLLDLRPTRSLDPDIQDACQYTGLSEETIKLLRLTKTVPYALNRLTAKEKDVDRLIDTPLFEFASAFLQVEKAASLAMLSVLSNNSDYDYYDMSQKKEALELAMFRFEKVCRDLPASEFQTDIILDELNKITRGLQDQEILAYFKKMANKEADDGEHQKD